MNNRMFYRNSWIEIDVDELTLNIKNIQSLHPTKHLFAIIKANAYGFGIKKFVEVALKNGVVGFGVSSLDEAIQLRRLIPDSNITILMLGYTSITHVPIASQHHISLTCIDEDWFDAIQSLIITQPLKLHLKINTGMNRLGFDSFDSFLRTKNKIEKDSHFILEGVYTHLATADNNVPYFEHQYQTFKQWIEEGGLTDLKYVHLSNSAATFRGRYTQALSFENTIRVGIGYFGVNTTDECLPFELKQPLSLYSQLTQVRQLQPGDLVGYGATYQAKEPHWMGVVPIGYADGWWRQNQGRSVLVQGKECEIIGRVCMDQLMVKLPYEMPIGEKVTLIGKGMSLDRVSRELNTIACETLCSLSDRLPRVYIEKGKETEYDLMRFKSLNELL